MLANSLNRRKPRKLLAVAGTWIGMTLVVALMMLGLDVGDRVSLELGSFGSNIKLEPLASSLLVHVGGHLLTQRPGSAYLEESDIDGLMQIFWRNNILGISPRLQTSVHLEDRQVELLGIWLDHETPREADDPFITGARQVYHHWRVEGSWPEHNPGTVVPCLLGANLARGLSLHPGDEFQVQSALGKERFSVSGVLSSGDGDDDAIIASMGDVQAFAGLPGKVSHVDVSALTTPENALVERYRQDPESLTPEEHERWVCTPYPGSVAADIQSAVPGSVARVVRRVSQTQGVVLQRIEGLMFLMALFTLATCSLGVAGVLTAAILERRKEVALMQAMGARKNDVLLLFMTESGLLGLLGGLMAAGTGSLLGSWLMGTVFGSKAAPNGALILLSPLIGMILALSATVVPVWRASSQDTAEILSGK